MLKREKYRMKRNEFAKCSFFMVKVNHSYS